MSAETSQSPTPPPEDFLRTPAGMEALQAALDAQADKVRADRALHAARAHLLQLRAEHQEAA